MGVTVPWSARIHHNVWGTKATAAMTLGLAGPGGLLLTVVATHLPASSDADRVRALEQIRALLIAGGGGPGAAPCVLLGDLNFRVDAGHPERDECTWALARVFGASGVVAAPRPDIPTFKGRHSPLDRVNWINLPLFRDDRLSEVVHKIRGAVPGMLQGDTLYLWAGVQPRDLAGFCNRLVASVFRGARRAPLQALMDVIEGLLPQKQSGDTGTTKRGSVSRASSLVEYPEAHRLAMDALRGAHGETRLLFDYTVDIAYQHAFPADPARATAAHLSPQPLAYTGKTDITLWDAGLGPQGGSVLNVMTKQTFQAAAEVPGLVDLYFPPELETATRGAGSSRPVDSERYARLLHAAKDLPADTLAGAAPHYSKLYVSVHPVGQPLSFRLRSVFNRFALDATCPLLVYRTSEQVVYKADMAALQDVDPWLVRYWTRAPAAKVESLMFKVVYQDFFATLILFPLLIYHVKLTFRTGQSPDADYVQGRVVPAVNAVLERVRELVAAVTSAQGIELPLLGPESFAPENLLQVNMACEVPLDRPLPPLHEMEARMLALPGLFQRVPIVRDGGVRRGVVQLRYIRCSNYNALADIEAHISTLSRSNMAGAREDIIAAVEKTYSLSRALAGELYDRIMDRGDDVGMAVYRSRYFEGVSVDVTRLSDRALRIDIRGSKIDAEFARHICACAAGSVVAGSASSATGRAGAQGTTKSPIAEEVRRSLRIQKLLGEADGADGDEGAMVAASAALFGEDAFAGSSAGSASDSGSDYASEGSATDREDEETTIPDEQDATDSSTVADAAAGPLGAGQLGPLGRLKRADPGLFAYDAKNQNYKSYASNCAANANRQPIVVGPEQAAALKKGDPSAYTNAVHAGSSPALRQKNVYICPDVWCPDSETAMGLDNYKRKGCPKEGETGLVMTDGSRKRYVSFLDPSRHPRELCAPCCFFVDHGNQGEGKRRWERMSRCQQQQEEAPAPGEEAEDTAPGAAKDLYVRGLVFPLQKDRYGRLPPALSKFLRGGAPCAQLAKLGSQPCYVRLGISHSGQHFLSAMAVALGEPGGAAGLVERASRMDPADFVGMNSGSLLRAFAPSQTELGADAYGALREWLGGTDRKRYVDSFGLGPLVRALKDAAEPAQLDGESALRARRELLVMLAMQNFANYLRAPTPKDHVMLLEMFCLWHRVGASEPLNILVVEEEADTGKLSAACLRYSFYSDVAAGRDAPTALIVKHRQFYEPVAWASAEGHSLRLKSGGEHWQVERARDAVMAACRAADAEFPAARALTVIKRAVGVSALVVGAGYRAVGVLTGDDAYVPLPAPCRLHPDFQDRCVHATDVLPRIKSRPLAAAIAVFKRLARELGPFYAHQVHPEGRALLLGGGDEVQYVPVVVVGGQGSQQQHSAFLEEHMDDLRILVGEQLTNEYLDVATQAAAQADVLAGFTTKGFERIMRDAAHKREFTFLRDAENNPFSTLHRLEHMVALLRRVCPEDTNEEVLERAAYNLLTREVALFDGGDAALAPGVEIFTQEQVGRGELQQRLQQRRQQPFVQAHAILPDVVAASGAGGTSGAGAGVLLAGGAT
ncbi:hypothetical protein HXX76_014088 [Chlamydomonas incerta]|uniref:Uncharacterized protein n=1 Tax=Chlamydomonas incerta TaxID=51695 RepID=A0A835VRC5_CHLIN|nr:hypothetical protein HXX76_014088 [Chlamydomonas incerta]|eukprot:KAG2424930.1 hypothetical protein HXX76_014088 [Chlamydomonas incerta]